MLEVANLCEIQPLSLPDLCTRGHLSHGEFYYKGPMQGFFKKKPKVCGSSSKVREASILPPGQGQESLGRRKSASTSPLWAAAVRQVNCAQQKHPGSVY